MSPRSVQSLVKTGRVVNRVLLFLCCDHAAVYLCVRFKIIGGVIPIQPPYISLTLKCRAYTNVSFSGSAVIHNPETAEEL